MGSSPSGQTHFLRRGYRIACLVISVLLGATVWMSQSGIEEAIAQVAPGDSEYLPFSRTVSIGDREVAVRCEGAGAPMVFLEGGYGGGIGDWALIQPELARHTRVCAYDRAGNGGSDAPLDGPHSAADASRDLQALLQTMRVDEPVLLAGFSIGGLLARHFAAQYPDAVSALVLIDPTPPTWTAMTLSGFAMPSRIARLLEYSGIDPGEPEPLDILKAGEEVFSSRLPPMPVFMLTSGIKSTNPGMYGDERRVIATRLQQDQARELDAEHEVAELCTHQLPLDCADVVSAFILRALEQTAGNDASDPLALYSSDAARPRRKSTMVPSVA